MLVRQYLIDYYDGSSWENLIANDEAEYYEVCHMAGIPRWMADQCMESIERGCDEAMATQGGKRMMVEVL